MVVATRKFRNILIALCFCLSVVLPAIALLLHHQKHHHKDSIILAGFAMLLVMPEMVGALFQREHINAVEQNGAENLVILRHTPQSASDSKAIRQGGLVIDAVRCDGIAFRCQP